MCLDCMSKGAALLRKAACLRYGFSLNRGHDTPGERGRATPAELMLQSIEGYRSELTRLLAAHRLPTNSFNHPSAWWQSMKVVGGLGHLAAG